MQGGHQVWVKPDDLPDPLLLRGQFTHGACCPPTPTGECELVWSLGQWGARRQETCPASPLYLPLVSASPAVSIPVQRRLCDGRFSLSPPPFHCLVSSTFPSLLTLTSLHLKKFPWIFNVIHTTFRFFFGLKSITCIYQKGIQQMLCHLFAVLHVAPFCEYSPNFVCILSITKRVQDLANHIEDTLVAVFHLSVTPWLLCDHGSPSGTGHARRGGPHCSPR